MPNPYNNKVQLADGTVLMDTSGVTVDAAHLASGYTALDASGALIVGTASSGGITPSGTKEITITSDGVSTHDVMDYANVQITVDTAVVPPPQDQSVDLLPYATITAAKWANGTITYPATGTNCVEFAFDMATIRANIPDGLVYGEAINLLRFGVSDTETYSNKFILVHEGTSVIVPNKYNPSGSSTTSYHYLKKMLIPAYDDCDSIKVYVFKRPASAPTSEDVASMTADLIAEICDMTYGPVSAGTIVKPDYSRQDTDYDVFAFADGVSAITVTQTAFDPSVGAHNPSYSVFATDGSLIGGAQIKTSAQQLPSPTLVHQDLPRDEDGYPVNGRKYIHTIVRPETGAYWGMQSAYRDAQTLIMEDRSTTDEHPIGVDEMRAIKSLYPQLDEYKGLFSRTLNGGASYMIRNQNPNRTQTTGAYYDILENGTNGDWYIYEYFNPLLIKNTKATWGDIVYRVSGTAYLALYNPFKWGNWQTVPESTYDIVIVGAGAGGIGAAYALRNSGLRVLLADKMPGLGGTHTQAGLHQMIGSPVGDWFKAVAKDAYDCMALRFEGSGSVFGETSTFDDWWDVSLAVNPSTKSTKHLNINADWLEKRYHDDLTAGGIDVRTRRKFLRHNDVGGRITSLSFLNEFTGAEEKVFASVVIDCTGDVYVGRYNRTLGTDFYIGSDPGTMYNESAASSITEGDIYDINTCEIMYRKGSYGDGNQRRDWYAFANTDEYADKDADFPTIAGVTKGTNATYTDHEYRIVYDPDLRRGGLTNSSVFTGYNTTVSPDYHCGITKQMLVDNGEERVHEVADDYARAHFAIDSRSTSNYYAGCYPLLAIREGYRMHCETMVTQADLEDTITTSNYEAKEIVALSSWYADLHKNSTVNTNVIQNTYKNGIPFGAMVPTSYTNLLIACRGYGASHIALSGIRLIKTIMSLGRAAGFAAKQYVDDGLRDVRNVDVAQLQEDCGVGDLLAYLEENVYPNFE